MKKARYEGSSGTGVDVVIALPDGQTRTVHVDHGHQLPTELEDGTTVPASERDKLLATDDWAEVKIPAPKPPDEKTASAADSATSTKKEG